MKSIERKLLGELYDILKHFDKCKVCMIPVSPDSTECREKDYLAVMAKVKKFLENEPS